MTSLMGTYYHNIDAKGRMNFPTKLREVLGTTFYVTKGLDQPCLTVYSETEWAVSYTHLTLPTKLEV